MSCTWKNVDSLRGDAQYWRYVKETVPDMGSEEILLTTGKLLLEFYLIMT